MVSYKVSVIVPIYGVESFIGRCAESLMRQTLKEVEYIFVDDATPDGSMSELQKVLDAYPERVAHVMIAHHDQNKGLPAARNTGLAMAHGDFIFHCDSDDFVEYDMLENLYREAEKKSADIVWCDYFISYEQSERYMKQPAYITPDEALRGMLCGRMKYNVWNKLTKRSLYTDNHIAFPSGYAMGEDMTIMMLFPFARKVAYLPKAYYHYVQWNASSMTQSYTDKHLISLKHNAQLVSEFMQRHYDKGWALERSSFSLLMKWPFLVGKDWKMYRLWKEWFPEANPYIWKDKNVSLRIRLVEWFASKGMFGLVWLHYWIVIRFFYSIAYK